MGLDQRLLLDVYARRSGSYDRFVYAVTLGLHHRLRTSLVRKLALRPGTVVLDLACGTGLNFAALEQAVGPAGRIVGVDVSADMLNRAYQKILRAGWTNVRLIQADITTFRPVEPLDAVLCTFAIGLLPDPDLGARAFVDMTRPGGCVLVADTHRVEHWYGPLVNPMLRLGGRPWIPPSVEDRYWSAHPQTTLAAMTENFHSEEWLGGTVYVAWGRRPQGPAA
ncbi:MAG: class I SAM-dependent methyltransferase [Thermoleophilia bacterium]|nr:class I SAM-dependent methyltransferase [Thermoleophilia bacterium]